MKLASLTLLLAGVVAAQPRAPAFVEQALRDDHAHAILRELTQVAPGRLSGTPAAAAAVEWAERALDRAGCDRVRLQEVMVPRWVRGDVAELVARTDEGEIPLAVLALGGSVGTPAEGTAAKVVEVRSFEQLREAGEAARGRIAFFNRPMPRALANTFMAYGQAVPQRTSGAIEAARAGAVAALVRSMTTADTDSAHTGAMEYEDGVPQVPAAAISTRGADRLAALLEREPELEVRLRLSCRSEEDVPSANVIGELTGRELPDEIVLIGAHLDSWDVGEGAHDDGAGCAHCIEAIRLIDASGRRPRRTIRVVLFMNEENGLRGARAYAAEHGKDRHVAAIESDRGGFAPLGFTTGAPKPRRDALRELLAPLRGTWERWCRAAAAPTSARSPRTVCRCSGSRSRPRATSTTTTASATGSRPSMRASWRSAPARWRTSPGAWQTSERARR
jgi:hypothetical protein